MSAAFILALCFVCAVSTALTGWCLYKGREAALPITSLILSSLFILLIVWSASQPVNQTPSPPFILYGAAGPYAWVGSADQGSPRTYLWSVPNELREALQKGPLQVEGKARTARHGDDEYFPFGEWRVSPYTPERFKK